MKRASNIFAGIADQMIQNPMTATIQKDDIAIIRPTGDGFKAHVQSLLDLFGEDNELSVLGNDPLAKMLGNIASHLRDSIRQANKKLLTYQN
jgi:hypothetical protein